MATDEAKERRRDEWFELFQAYTAAAQCILYVRFIVLTLQSSGMHPAVVALRENKTVWIETNGERRDLSRAEVEAMVRDVESANGPQMVGFMLGLGGAIGQLHEYRRAICNVDELYDADRSGVFRALDFTEGSALGLAYRVFERVLSTLCISSSFLISQRVSRERLREAIEAEFRPGWLSGALWALNTFEKLDVGELHVALNREHRKAKQALDEMRRDKGLRHSAIEPHQLVVISMSEEITDMDRLKAVQLRIRALANEHPWFAEALRAAFLDFNALLDRRQAEQKALDAREADMAYDLLRRGMLRDPQPETANDCIMHKVTGLCPALLAEELKKFPRSEALPKDVEQRGAAAALSAMEWSRTYNDHGLAKSAAKSMADDYNTKINAGTHVPFTWWVVMPRPADWSQPLDPYELDAETLACYSELDYLTIALYRLGGLADTGAIRPRVPEPADTGDMIHDVGLRLVWENRLACFDEPGRKVTEPDPVKFPPGVAQQMLDDVEVWFRSEVERRAELDDELGVVVPTMADLAAAVGISNDTFGRVREAAGIVTTETGAAASHRRYSPTEVDRLIDAALNGAFRERIAMAEKWAKWGNKSAKRLQGRNKAANGK